MRKPIPPNIQADLFARSRRRCAICFGIHRNTTDKHGQIAHIDQNNENAEIDNLVWLCLEHHDQYDSRTSQSKNYTATEIRQYRDQLYEFVRKNYGEEAGNLESGKNIESAFLIGKQLQELRSEIDVSTSEFIELVGFHSEKLYKQMENNEIECRETVIQKISFATGVLPNWLKHGSTYRMCDVESLLFLSNDKGQATQSAHKIIECSSGPIYVTIFAFTPKSDVPLIWPIKNLWAQARDRFLHIGVCAPVGKFKYKIFDTHISLGVSDPEMLGYYASAYFFLSTLREKYWVDARGIIISNWKDEEDLYGGRVHPERILTKHYYKHDADWLPAVLDFKGNSREAGNINSVGNWPRDIQAKFRHSADNTK